MTCSDIQPAALVDFFVIPKNGHAHTNMPTAKLSDVAIENANPKQKPYL